MDIIVNILLFILILGFIVFVHELGHFTWAKICGVYVYEFALGMGPKIWSKKGKETTYSIRAVPIGGFCAMAGEDVEDDELKKIPKKKRLQSKTPFQRFLIMFFGAGNNFISAFLLLFFIALIWGGTTLNPVVTEVMDGGAAQQAGMQAGDKITYIDNHKIKTSDDISIYLAVGDHSKKTEIDVIKENGEKVTYRVMPQKTEQNGNEVYVYGIMMQQKQTHGFVASLRYMVEKSTSLCRQMTITLKYLFTGHISLKQLSGPVGIYSIVGQQKESGIQNLLFLVAFLSINVGFINLLPLPAFDGGHIVFIIIEILRGGKPVPPEIEAKVHTVGMILLLLLMLVITISDVIKLF